jgi:hypothetical protein
MARFRARIAGGSHIDRLPTRSDGNSGAMTSATWKPHTEHGELSSNDREELPDEVFAFPKQRKEPLTDAAHVRTALARFDQVKDVSDTDRELAFANIRKAAKHYGVDVAEDDWRQLGRRPHTPNPNK